VKRKGSAIVLAVTLVLVPLVAQGVLPFVWALAILGWTCLGSLLGMHLHLLQQVAGFVERLGQISAELRLRSAELRLRVVPKPWKGLPRITVAVDRMGGVPCVRDTRIPVVSLVRMVANRLTVAEILEMHSDLEADDVREALLYAAEQIAELSESDPA
jgi:uncharacterized protein (DUF433 family)